MGALSVRGVLRWQSGQSVLTGPLSLRQRLSPSVLALRREVLGGMLFETSGGWLSENEIEDFTAASYRRDVLDFGPLLDTLNASGFIGGSELIVELSSQWAAFVSCLQGSESAACQTEHMQSILALLGNDHGVASVRSALATPTFRRDDMRFCAANPTRSVPRDYRQNWAQVTVTYLPDCDSGVPLAMRQPYLDFAKLCIETWWNNRFDCRAGDELPCPISFEVRFEPTAPDADDLDFNPGRTGGGESRTGWDDAWAINLDVFAPGTNPNAEESRRQILLPVHEFGHSLGLWDEYAAKVCTDVAFLEDVMAGIEDPGPSIMASTSDFETTFPERLFVEFAQNIGTMPVEVAESQRFSPTRPVFGSFNAMTGVWTQNPEQNAVTTDALESVRIAFGGV